MTENINNQDFNNGEPKIQTIIQPEIGSTNVIENVPIKQEIIYPKIKISSNKRN